MRRIGILGGIGPESTIAYYRLLIERVRAGNGATSYPEFAIETIDMTAMLDRVARVGEDPTPLIDFLVDRIRRLVDTGAEVVGMASNTPHIVAPAVADAVDVELVSIVDATSATLADSGCRRVALFGTAFTMQGGFYQSAARAVGVEVVVPAAEDQAYVHEKYMNELVRNVIEPETRRRLVSIVEGLIATEAVDGLVLGGTELPLILSARDVDGLPVFDTTEIHVDALLAAATN